MGFRLKFLWSLIRILIRFSLIGILFRIFLIGILFRWSLIGILFRSIDQVCSSPNFIFSTSFWMASTSGCWGWQWLALSNRLMKKLENIVMFYMKCDDFRYIHDFDKLLFWQTIVSHKHENEWNHWLVMIIKSFVKIHFHIHKPEVLSSNYVRGNHTYVHTYWCHHCEVLIITKYLLTGNYDY